MPEIISEDGRADALLAEAGERVLHVGRDRPI
jgi:hypothetical protein